MGEGVKIRNVHDVAAWRLCLGCGACFGVCPEGRVRLADVEDDGIRPFLEAGGCRSCGTCLKACPGVRTSAPLRDATSNGGADALRWGSFLEVWEGFAGDPMVRFEKGAAVSRLDYCATPEIDLTSICVALRRPAASRRSIF